MADRYEALRKAAEEATQGTWAAGSTEISTVEEAVAICRENIEKTRNPTRHFCELYTSEGNGLRIALVGHGPNSIPNVEYLALAQPAAILEILAERARLETKCETLESNLRGTFEDGKKVIARTSAERDALAAQVEALKVDAERYRYLRDKTSADRGTRGRQYFRMPLPMPLNNPFKGSVAEHLDDAIDAARKEPS